MSPHDANHALLSRRGEAREAAVGRSSTHEYAMLEEFSFVRREAQTEANLAYEDWRHRPCSDAYAVYRAAQDRADAAQDDLANWVAHITA